MRQLKPITLIVGIFFIIAVSALRLMATSPSNTICQATGGCSFPCSSSQNGQSSNLISASQLSQCSPQNLSNCPSAGTYGVCGVFYIYSAPGCDPATIEDSTYDYNYFCSPG